jgi:hypothetical protein
MTRLMVAARQRDEHAILRQTHRNVGTEVPVAS